MTLIVDKDIKKIVINRNVSGTDEKIFHIQQDADLILIGIEEIKQEEEDEN